MLPNHLNRECTICFPLSSTKILLAMKKEGFGEGNYNGFGGKFDSKKGDVSIEDTAIRELEEEQCLFANLFNLEKLTILDFIFPAKPIYSQRVHVYGVRNWKGFPTETKEVAKGEWFSQKDIPYDTIPMWDSDKIWLKEIMTGRKIYGIFTWKNDNKTVDTYTMVDLSEFKE